MLFDYIPTPSSIPNQLDQACPLLDKLSESSVNSTSIISLSNELTNKNQLKSINTTNNRLKESNCKCHNGNRPEDGSISPNQRAFSLYPNCLSDWDSTDSESGTNGINSPN